MSSNRSLRSNQLYLMANGDLRLSANQRCWPAQARMEAALSKALKAEGWLDTGSVSHDQTHVRDLKLVRLPSAEGELGRRLGREFKERKAIMGVFDEGCMGMFNAIIPDELLHPTGLFKERLSQSSLYAAMQQVSHAEAREILDWLLKKGMTFRWGKDEETELTESQTLQQCTM